MNQTPEGIKRWTERSKYRLKLRTWIHHYNHHLTNTTNTYANQQLN